MKLRAELTIAADFDTQITRHIAFVQKGKTVRLTLKDTKRVYSEQLGKEIGFYKDPYNDYGRLEDQQLRAIRLVVDTGIHYKHWTRDQVVQYFHDHSAIDEPNVQSETNRYISWPGQALSYKMGQLKILELRAQAQKELASKFDIQEFHDQVIDSGALPLDVLEQQINEWIAQKRETAAGQH